MNQAVKQPSEKKNRVRLNPEKRKTMILDNAARLIASEGVATVTMERLANEAGVSKALVYNYFPNITTLLQVLLDREYRHLRRLQYEAAESAKTLEQMVRRITHVYLSYIAERGLLIERLAVEPSVANSGDPTSYSREVAVNYLAEILHENFGIEMSIAKPAVDISYGIPAAAGQYIIEHKSDFEMVEEITVTMILGAIESVTQKYQISLKTIKR